MRQSASGTRGWDDNAPDRSEGRQAMIGRLIGAVLRAVLVAMVIATPSILLPGTMSDTTQMVVLLAVVAAIFTFVEYNALYPSLVEFRDAPPLNRIRFIAVATTVFCLALIERGHSGSNTITDLARAAGERIGDAIDFPYSPVRLMVLMLPPDASASLVESVRTAAGFSYLVSILALGIFVAVLRLGHWPARRTSFNVWTNLPTFDPTSGGDVVARLRRDSGVNLILGFLLPFIIPAFVKLAANILDPVSLKDPQTLIWMMTAWAFLPASLLMRGIALAHVADLICLQRQKTFETDEGRLATV